MKRPILEKIGTRLLLGFVLGAAYMMLMNGKLNFDATFFNYPLLTIGTICIMIGWFNYLKYDGIRLNLEIDQHNREKKAKRKSKHKTKQMVDYTDETIREDQELLEGEKVICNMIANFVSGFILVTPSVILLIIGLVK